MVNQSKIRLLLHSNSKLQPNILLSQTQYDYHVTYHQQSPKGLYTEKYTEVRQIRDEFLAGTRRRVAELRPCPVNSGIGGNEE